MPAAVDIPLPRTISHQKEQDDTMDLPYRLKNSMTVTEWDPTQFFREGYPSSPYALLILNHPINEKAYDVLQRHACITVCADGGANRFYEMMKARGRESTDFPSAIIGDLDSIHPEIRTHYETLGVPVIQHIDDYSTDFHKSLQYIQRNTATILAAAAAPTPSSSSTPPPPPPPSNSATTTKPTSTSISHSQHPPKSLEILVLGGLGGRVDQAFSQIHHLFYMTQELRATTATSSSDSSTDEPQSQPQGHQNPGPNLYLISEESITFILRPGRNIVQTPLVNRPAPAPTSNHDDDDDDNADQKIIPEVQSSTTTTTTTTTAETHLLEENVGIIPLLGPARITTAGFQWDVRDWRTEIGGQLSTSNHIRADMVEVEAKMPVLLTLELAERFKKK
ncbi:thiamine pyrophosphokinase [Aspergillus uvarum CBS 121591]|uniref:Thiamine pyrophosphokinase n=1 Tax=Aspergillus uvarum CBS 121591 TaxID=1448315 RepID=A0A319C5F6_9EURO|nr:thiamine pyrophosphokinase [Aspergillus uvarum CBS 121591]PYH80394.1 thiamine pyrophosphokinase [Aspergillus uvarum CBS 121591]